MTVPQSKKLTKLERKIAHMEAVVEANNQPLTDERVFEAMVELGIDPKDMLSMSEIKIGYEEGMSISKPKAERRLAKLKVEKERRAKRLAESGPKTG